MAKGLVDEQNLTDIANAIRAKNGTDTQYKPSEMANAITNLPSSSTKAVPEYISFYNYDGNSLDLSWLDTSNMTSMRHMFENCNSLTELDVSNFDTSKVTDMSYMFYGCARLTSLNLTNFNTNNVTNFNYMFTNCKRLATIDISSMNAPDKQGGFTFDKCGAGLETPTIVYVKDEAMQQWVLNNNGVPENWSTENVIIKEVS